MGSQMKRYALRRRIHEQDGTGCYPWAGCHKATGTCTYVLWLSNQAFRLSNQRMKYLSTTPDFREGPLAFTEKRAPVWTGTAGVDKAKL